MKVINMMSGRRKAARWPSALMVLICLVALMPTRLHSQSITGLISGTVNDSSGSAVAGASVKLLDPAMGTERTIPTDGKGDFAFSSVTPGDYNLIVSATGFKNLEKKNIHLSPSDRLSVGTLVLEVGATTTTVTVSAQAAALQTASGERSGVVDSRDMTGLMSQGRNVLDLMALLPGVTGGSGSVGFSASWTIQVQGQQNNTSVNLDGAYINATNMGNSEVAVSMDSVAEVKVLVANYQAEYGRVSGANVQLVSKSGSTEFHGLGSYFKRHEEFNANSFFNNLVSSPKSRYRYNGYTYQIGGPVYIPGKFNAGKDKLFFFWNQEFWPSSTSPLTESNVPTALERQGNFSASDTTSGALIPIHDPFSGGPAFTGNIIPTTSLNSSGVALLNMFPLPNYTNTTVSKGQYNYIFSATTATPAVTSTLKIDYNVNTNNILSVNYTHASFDSNGYSVPSGSTPGWNQLDQNVLESGNLYIARYQHIFSPSTVNELTFSFDRRPWAQVGLPAAQLAKNQSATVGFTAGQLFPSANPLGIVPSATFGSVPPNSATLAIGDGRFPFYQDVSILTTTDNLSKQRGSHTIKAGFYFDNTWNLNGVGDAFNGSFNFGQTSVNPMDTGYAYANAALGTFQTYSQASLRPEAQYTIPNIEWFVQDNWKIMRRLTLDYGMRFAEVLPEKTNDFPTAGFEPTAYSAANAPELIRPGLQGTTRVGVNPVTGAILPAALIGALAPNVGIYGDGMISHESNRDVPQSLYHNPGVQLGPRIGFAYDVFGDGKTAVRGGFGMFYGRLTSAVSSNNLTIQPPLVQVPIIYYGTLSTFLTSSDYLSPGSVTGIDPNFKNPTTMNFSLSVQRELWRNTILDVAYAGSLVRHNFSTDPLNFIPPGSDFLAQNLDSTTGKVLPANFLRPYVGFSTINYYKSVLTSNYHSMQVTLNRRMRGGLEVGGAWTWSKDLGYNGIIPGINPNVWEYGLQSIDRTHVVQATFLYDLPKLSTSERLIKGALNNWHVSGLLTFESGVPQSVGISTTNGEDITGSPDLSPRPLMLGNPVLPKSQRTFAHWFNTAAFGLPPVGSIGNAPPYQFRGPGLNNWNISVFKDFPVYERMRLQFRSEFYNAFNHTQFSSVNTSAQFNPTTGAETNTAFGELTAAAAPRVIQLVARFVF